MKKEQILKQVSLWSIMGTAFLSILLVLPITDNFIDDTKSYLLFFSSALIILLFIVKALKEKAIKITISPLTNALVFFGLAALASTFFTSTYPIESLLGMGGVYLSATVIAVLGGSLLPKNSISKFISGITVAGVILVLTSILQMVGAGPAQLINKLVGSDLPTSGIFNIAGSPFIAIQVLFVTLVGVVASIISSKKVSKIFAVSLPILVVGVGIYAWNLLPGKETSLVLPPLNTSWSVMLDTIRNPKSALIGAGPSAYPNLYTTFKPAWVNNTSSWSSIFSQASTFPLTLFSTMGVIGLSTWGFFVVKFTKLKKNTLLSSGPIVYMIGSSILLQLLLPINTTMLTIQVVAIALLIANEKHRLPLLQLQTLKFKILNKLNIGGKVSKSTNIPFYLSTGVLLLGSATLFYFIVQAYSANLIMAQSSRELAKNDLVKTYELQQKAVSINPYMDTFRRRYSGTNIAIAIALSNKADITDLEKQQVSSLLQQSVREAKAATSLDPAESQNWVNLAQVYKNMIGVSEDAAQWTIQSYVSAIETDPNNPALRIELANVFSSQKDYQQAISILSQAISIKPDLAGSHFNLGLVLEKLDQPDAYRKARISYQRALVLLEASSEEYILVNKKIEEIEFTMKEKGISIEVEQQEQTGGQEVGETLINQGAETGEDSEISTPSITEQNLNDAGNDSVNDQDVNLNPAGQDSVNTDSAETNLSEEL